VWRWRAPCGAGAVTPHWWRASRQGAADEEPAARHEPRGRAGKKQRTGDQPAHRRAARRERALAEIAPGQQGQQQDERRRQEQQAGFEATEVQAREPQRGHHGHADRDAHPVVRSSRHRTVAFTVVAYSSKSETRSVTASFQSPPGLSVTASAT
jgi:hypothetical protein